MLLRRNPNIYSLLDRTHESMLCCLYYFPSKTKHLVLVINIIYYNKVLLWNSANTTSPSITNLQPDKISAHRQMSFNQSNTNKNTHNVPPIIILKNQSINKFDNEYLLSSFFFFFNEKYTVCTLGHNENMWYYILYMKTRKKKPSSGSTTYLFISIFFNFSLIH